MSRHYQNLGLPPEVSPLTVLRTAIRRLCPHLFPASAGGIWRRRTCHRPRSAQEHRLDQHP